MKKNARPKVRTHIWIDKETNDKLHLYFDANPGYSAAIDTILKKAVQQIEGTALASVANASATAPTEELFHE